MLEYYMYSLKKFKFITFRASQLTNCIDLTMMTLAFADMRMMSSLLYTIDMHN